MIVFRGDETVLLTALREARKEIEPIEKGKENPFFGNRYVDLDAIKAEVDPVLDKHGMYITQWPSMTPTGEPALTTMLVHESGSLMYSNAALSLSKKDPQALGSALTYMRRYSYTGILGIKGIDPDDDGNVASQSDKAVTPKGGKADTSNASAEVKRLRTELENTARTKGWSRAKLTKWYHDAYGVDYKQDTDEGNLGKALASVILKDDQ